MNSYGFENNSWVLYMLLIFGAVWIQNANFVAGETTDEEKIKSIYTKLYEDYKHPDNFKTDCDVMDINSQYNKWGTQTTLGFLAEIEMKLSETEKLTNRTKLRMFLARVGYLKVPGSLVFLNEDADTLRLEGCKDGTPQWRLQGELEQEKDFFQTGKLKTAAPNAANYMHKFTCSIPGKCSHTFYVITKLKPEIPLGVLLRKDVAMEVDSYLFNCAIPFCNVKPCFIGKTTTVAQRRSYPPYIITWNLKSRKPENDVDQGAKIKNFAETHDRISIDNKDAASKFLDIKVLWEMKLRKADDDPLTVKDSYEIATSDNWIDAFGENHNSKKDDKHYSFNSRIIIRKPDKEYHSGPYECMIEDSNGVISTPNEFPDDRDWLDYEGRTSVFVIDSQRFLTICFGGTTACIFATFIIILICPKKMEYDDGTPYTKDELVAPSNKKEEKNRSAGPSASNLKSKSSGKSIKPDKSSSSGKQQVEG